MKKLILCFLILCFMTSCGKIDVFKIKDKERIVESSVGSVESFYLVYTDKGVLKNVDNWWFFKANSSDIQGELDVGKCYEIKKRFWRIAIISAYPNIMKIIRKVDCPELE